MIPTNNEPLSPLMASQTVTEHFCKAVDRTASYDAFSLSSFLLQIARLPSDEHDISPSLPGLLLKHVQTNSP